MLNKILYYIDTHPIGKIFNLGQNKAVWKKVTELKTGIKIAIEKDGKFDWDEIISIKKVGRERVYDIEVEGIHNFVGNGIIAHNTFITGDVGIGTTAPTTALHIGTNAETHSLSTADVLISSDLELDGVLYLDGGTISNSAGTASLVLSSAPTTTANSLSGSNWLIENTANLGQAALMVNQTKAGDLFTASASGTPKFTIHNDGAITLASNISSTTNTTEGTIFYDNNSAGSASTDHLFLYGSDSAWHRIALDLTKYTNTNASVANGSYIDVAHNQNSNDLVTNGWVYNTATSKWEQIDVSSNEQATNSAQVNFNTEANYTQENMAYAVTLTPSATSGNITLTLGSGTWNSDARVQAGCRVTGNGGVANITGTPAAQTTITATTTTNFTNTNAIASGSWYLYCTTFDGSVATLNTQPDSYTKSLLHTDGTDASTTFTDEIGKTWTAGGNAQIDTAQSKFGGASGLFDGTGDYITTPDHADFTLSSGDFTIDFWTRFSAFNAINMFYGQADSSSGSTSVASYVNSSNGLLYTYVYYGASSASVYSTTTFAINTWYHVAIVRNGNTLTQYIDGVANGTIDMTGITLNDSNQVMAIGRLGAYDGYYMKGWIEEFRFSKGIARWATGFTPPTSQYNTTSSPTSQNYSVVTNSDQLATASWDHVENAVVTETLNSQTINYSVSFDGRTTFSIYDSTTSNNGWRPIARNNSGTWQYNSNTTAGVSNVTWTSATYNSQNGAISQAAGVTQNQMSGTTLNAVTALQWREINGFTPTTNTIDFAAALKTTSAAQIPQVDQIKVNYTQAGMKIVQTDANTVRLYNYSGATQNLRLDAIIFGADLAEWYTVDDPTISAGDLVSITGNLDSFGVPILSKSKSVNDNGLVGAISTKAGKTLGIESSDRRLLALAGRIPVKIDPESPAIQSGSNITSSNKEGYATLAMPGDRTIGKATENWEPNTGKDTITIIINNSYAPNPTTIKSQLYRFIHNTRELIDETTQRAIIQIGVFAKLVSPDIETTLISPIANTDLIIDLQPDDSQEASRFVIKGVDDQEVASIDATGKVTSYELQVMSDATVSGTLYADDIESQRLEDIEELLREVETNQLLLTEAANWNINTATASADLTATNLFVTGQAAITSLFVSDNLTTKNINSLTEPLSIQSLASAPLEIMAGKIIIDTDGNTKFLGNVEIAGDLKINNIIVANNIDPVATESGSIIEGEINSNATAGKAVLTANTEKIRINNNKVSLNTLIYITPITSTQNKVLYVKAKDTGFFDIGFSDTLDTDVEFNWWIIELEPILDVTN